MFGFCPMRAMIIGFVMVLVKVIIAAGVWLTISSLAGTLGFVALLPRYWVYLALMLVVYVILTPLVKTWFYRRFGE
jgi:Mg2+-importing ATPase